MSKFKVRSGFVEQEDCRLFVKQIFHPAANENSPVWVFLHDSWGCTEMWNNFPDQLVELSGWNALVYDRRGYGKSSPFADAPRTNSYLHEEAEALDDLLKSLGMEKAMLYGHSDGASIALIAAARYPERIHGVVVEGAHSFVEDKCKEMVLAAREKSKHSGLLTKLEIYHGENTAELFRRWHTIWLDPAFASWSITNLLPCIKCPVLAFQGDNDPFGTVEQLNVLAQNIPARITIKEIAGAQHTPRNEAADVTMGILKDFLEKILKE